MTITPYYDRNGITIYCGDCLEVMPELEVDSIDAIIADLPYGVTELEWDSIIDFERLWAEYKRVTKENKAVVLFSSQPFTTDLINSNREWFKYDLVWDKINPSGFLNVNRMPLRVHESVLVFSDQTGTYNPQMRLRPVQDRRRGGYEFEGTKQQHNGVYRDGLIKGSGYRGEYSNPISIITLNTGGAWTKRRQLHPSEKPVPLLSYLIRTYSNPGDLILDNATGSGTTLVAAQNEGRRAVGIELSEEYCRVAVDRLRQPSFFSIADTNPDQTVQNQQQLPLLQETVK